MSYEFSLERHVPAEHMLRAIDRFVDLDELRAHLAVLLQPYRSFFGGSRLLVVSYCFGIRWRLCEEVHLNLAYR